MLLWGNKYSFVTFLPHAPTHVKTISTDPAPTWHETHAIENVHISPTPLLQCLALSTLSSPQQQLLCKALPLSFSHVTFNPSSRSSSPHMTSHCCQTLSVLSQLKNLFLLQQLTPLFGLNVSCQCLLSTPPLPSEQHSQCTVHHTVSNIYNTCKLLCFSPGSFCTHRDLVVGKKVKPKALLTFTKLHISQFQQGKADENGMSVYNLWLYITLCI